MKCQNGQLQERQRDSWQTVVASRSPLSGKVKKHLLRLLAAILNTICTENGQ